MAVSGDLVIGEKSSVSAVVAVVSVEVGDDMWGWFVSDREFRMKFFYFQKWMNSMSFCYFCVDLCRAPKIMKIFV